MKEYNLEIKGIDCPHCAEHLKKKIAGIDNITSCELLFDEISTLTYSCEEDHHETVEEEIRKIIDADTEAEIEEHHHHHKHDEECACGHEHHHHHEHDEECACGHEHHHHHEHDEECNCGHEHHHHHEHDEVCTCGHEHHHHHEHEEECTCGHEHHHHHEHDEECACGHEHHHHHEHDEECTCGHEHHHHHEHDEECACGHEHHHHHEHDEECACGHEHHHHHEHDEECTCGHEHHHYHEHDEECTCGHEHHHHHHEHVRHGKSEYVSYVVEGIDCAACAHELEEEIEKIDGVIHCTIDFGVRSRLRYEVESDKKDAVEKEMIRLIEEDQQNPIITKEENKGIVHAGYVIDGIDCAACARELEEEIEKLDGVTNCSLTFGVHSRLEYDVEKDLDSSVETKVRKIIEDDQINPVITRLQTTDVKLYKFRIHNIDCANCANELAEAAEKIDGVVSCEADFMNELLMVKCAPKDRMRVEKDLIAMVKEAEPEVECSYVRDTKVKAVEEEKKDYTLYRLIIGAILFVVSLRLEGVAQIVVALSSYLILGYDVLLKAVRNIGRGQLFDEHFLMSLATLAAIYLKDWKEAAGVMLFYQIGEYFQAVAVARSRKSIADLMDIRPEAAFVLRDGEFVQAEPEEVGEGEIIRVRPGERIPLDGVVVSGASSLDTASLTGESRLRDVDVNDEVLSGSVNQNGVLEIRVTKEYGESTVARILELVENNDTNKAEHEKFITKFAKYYTPAVVISAVIVAILVGIFTKDFNEGIYRACTFLVISCPCALVISIPLSFFAGIGGLSSRGVLVKGANVIDALAKVEQVIMDKTGTLTSGVFAVEEVIGAVEEKEVLKDAAYAEQFSNHPIAEGIRRAFEGSVADDAVSDVKEIAGRGISVIVDGKEILAGNEKLLKERNIAFEAVNAAGTLVYVAKDGVYEGCLVLRDQIKNDAVEAVKQLHEDGRKCIIVSGDNQDITDEIGKKIGVDQAIGNCLPADKVERVKELMKNGPTAFVGDGINDAPVIVTADVGFAMGALGSDAAIEAADVVLMDDAPTKVSLAISASRRILKIANQNIYGAIIIKIATLILGAFGYANMWMAIFADTGVAMLCVLNSMRLLYIARKK